MDVGSDFGTELREEEIHFSRKMGYTHDANGYEEVWQKADTVQI